MKQKKKNRVYAKCEEGSHLAVCNECPYDDDSKRYCNGICTSPGLSLCNIYQTNHTDGPFLCHIHRDQLESKDGDPVKLHRQSTGVLYTQNGRILFTKVIDKDGTKRRCLYDPLEEETKTQVTTALDDYFPPELQNIIIGQYHPPHTIKVCATEKAFAALIGGRVAAWGDPRMGGEIPASLEPTLREVKSICALMDCFLALTNDGQLIEFGRTNRLHEGRYSELVLDGGTCTAIGKDQDKPLEFSNARAPKSTNRSISSSSSSSDSISSSSSSGHTTPPRTHPTSDQAPPLKLSNASSYAKLWRGTVPKKAAKYVELATCTLGAAAVVLDNGSIVIWGHTRQGGSFAWTPEPVRSLQF
jgi:hypothetical protein